MRPVSSQQSYGSQVVRDGLVDPFCAPVHAPHSPFRRYQRAEYQLWYYFFYMIQGLRDFFESYYQDKIEIGVGAYPKFEKLHFWHLLWMPFTKAVK